MFLATDARIFSDFMDDFLFISEKNLCQSVHLWLFHVFLEIGSGKQVSNH